jgi:hypothetical protein
MRLTSKLISWLLAGAAAAAVPACAAGGGYVTATYATPPAPRAEYVTYRPGYIWVHGHWRRDVNGRWYWQDGYYVRERPGYVYVPGHWERRGNHYVWREGGWYSRGRVTVRRSYY